MQKGEPHVLPACCYNLSENQCKKEVLAFFGWSRRQRDENQVPFLEYPTWCLPCGEWSRVVIMIAMSPGPPPYEKKNEPMVEGGGCNLKRVEVRVVRGSFLLFFLCFCVPSVSLVILDVFFFQCDQCTNYGFLHVCEGCFLLRCWLALFCSTFRL